MIEEGSKDLGRFAQLAVGSMQVDVPKKMAGEGAGSASPPPYRWPMWTCWWTRRRTWSAGPDPDNTSGLYFVLRTKASDWRTTMYAGHVTTRASPVIPFVWRRSLHLQVRHGYYENWVRPCHPDWDGRLQIWIAWNSLSVRVRADQAFG